MKETNKGYSDKNQRLSEKVTLIFLKMFLFNFKYIFHCWVVRTKFSSEKSDADLPNSCIS